MSFTNNVLAFSLDKELLDFSSSVKAGLHNQSFCDYSRYFAKVNSKFLRFVENI